MTAPWLLYDFVSLVHIAAYKNLIWGSVLDESFQPKG